jgi:hypothetical protein
MLLFALTVAAAHAGCDKDTDCKGDRICDAGVCGDPGDAAAQPTGRAASPKPDVVWASRGAVRVDGAPARLADLEPDLRTNPRAAHFLSKAKTERALGVALMAGGLAAIAGGAVVATTHHCLEFYDGTAYCSSNWPTGATMIGAGLGVGLGAGLPLGGAANRNERRAVEAYTGVSVRYTGAGAAVAWTGAW